MSARIRATVLSGYLGAGKTTIVNHVLSQPHGIRLAVLVNDFGPVNIDASLIRGQGERIVELSNGCVCCSIGNDLGEALSAIAVWPEPPERLLLEASGVAEPARIAMTVGHWPGFELDAVIVAADAETVQERAHDKYVGALVHSQLRSADLVALTKGDIAGPDKAAQAKAWLRAAVANVRVVEAAHGRIPREILLGLPHRGDGPGDNPRIHHHSHADFATSLWRPDRPVDTEKLRRMLSGRFPFLHRAKGFVTDGRTGDKVLIQSVGARCEISAAVETAEPGLVLIIAGGECNLADITRELDGCRIAWSRPIAEIGG